MAKEIKTTEEDLLEIPQNASLTIGAISISSPYAAPKELAELVVGLLQNREIREYLDILKNKQKLKECNYTG